MKKENKWRDVPHQPEWKQPPPERRDFQEQTLNDFWNEYNQSLQIIKHCKNPDLLEWHQGRIDHHKPFLERAGLLQAEQQQGQGRTK